MDKKYNDVGTFVLFYILCFIGLIFVDLLGHNSSGAYIGPITFQEIDWMQNSIISLVAASISTIVLHEREKRL